MLQRSWTLCHLKNSELDNKLQKYKGRVVSRGETVKDGSGSYAVFTEQGSSASHMTAANVSDVISRLPDCAGEASDAVSAYTLEKWKMVQTCEDYRNVIWIRMPRSRSPKSWDNMTDLEVPLERNFCGHPLAGLLVGTKTRRSSVEGGMEKSISIGMLLQCIENWLMSISIRGWF